MTNYKLLQLEPTPEMVEAAEDAYMPFGDMDLALRMAILAAPDVQGELDVEYGPTPGCKQCEEAMSINLDSCPECEAEFCAPQPAEQQESVPDGWRCRFIKFMGEMQSELEDFHDDPIPSEIWSLWRELLDTTPQPAEQKPSPHPDDAAVDRFAAAMKAKLTKKRQQGRGGWQSMTAEQLSALLHEHVRKGDPVDVGNLAMMLHQNGQRIEQQPLKSSLVLEAATHLTNWLDMNWCECEGSHICGYNDVKRTRDALLVAAEQPDVTQLVEALEEISDPIRFMGERLKEGERLNGMAAVQLAGDASYLRGIAIAALAAHRKQGGE